MTITEEYRVILQSFIDGRLSVSAFETAYLDKFKNETRDISESDFEVLDELFGDVDSYTSDADLIADNPDFYLSEDQLKQRVLEAIVKLKR
jgi:hypothetical protein